MAPLPRTAVTVSDDGITVDAELLAPKLGLTADALRENMAKGLVTSIAETGVDEDAGRTRLTFRYRARVWRVVLEADGTPVDAPAPATEAPPAKGGFNLLDMARDAS